MPKLFYYVLTNVIKRLLMGEMLGQKKYALDLLNLENVMTWFLLWISAVQIKIDWLYCIVRMQNGTMIPN